ncbi:MAG: hypothetical protein J7604_24100 [Sporocytophaga sp.]|uniref:hypothetical protein n=1 Tax=Sporocytophaga sp. TaxID=2231183 RepID=UPI001B00A752|nr:hypothetical protein [Sporocytophaga sp.]MBO9703319.1 hypothetical protein [Sporocytophaga sp.]
MELGIKEKWNKLKGKLSEKASDFGEKIGKHGPFQALEKDAKLGRTLHSECIAAMNILQEKQPSVKELLQKSYGFAVIPAIGSASLVLGGDYGVGEVFVKDHVIGYAGIGKVTLGVQVGGTNFHQMIVFNNEETWKQFKAGKYSFAADAGVAIVKAGAQASKGFGAGTVAFVFNEGGMLLDLDIGIQKFIFKPTVLGKVRTTEGAKDEASKEEGENEEGNENRENQSSKQRPPEPRK